MKKFNYNNIINNHKWIIEKGKNAIISFDFDGWLSALLLQHYLDWNILGYYDSENLIIKKNTKSEDCIFLDVEIFKNNIRSIGHHLIVYDFNNIPSGFDNKIDNCINPNFIRKYDRKNNYTDKYPFGTFHFLHKILIKFDIIQKEEYNNFYLNAIFSVDGIGNSYEKYNKNVKEWSEFMEFDKLKWWKIFKNGNYNYDKNSTYNLLDNLCNGNYKSYKSLNNFSKISTIKMLNLLSSKTPLKFNKNNWEFDDLKNYKFKRNYVKLKNNHDFNKIWSNKPFSMNTYSYNKISYTTETNHVNLP